MVTGLKATHKDYVLQVISLTDPAICKEPFPFCLFNYVLGLDLKLHYLS